MEQVCHPQLGAASSKTTSRNRHSHIWEPLQSRSHCDLDHCHTPHCHVRPWHERDHQCHRRNQCLLHLYLPWCVYTLDLFISAHTFIGFVLSLTCESLWMRLTCVQGVRGFALLSVSKVNLVCLCIAGLCLVFTMETESVTPTVR